MQHTKVSFYIKKTNREKNEKLKIEKDKDRVGEKERERQGEDGCRSESEIRSCKGIKNTFI